MSAAEFSLTIIEKLLVKRSSEDLQAELFDLCGFERFDMISSILDKREGLVAAHKVRRAGHSGNTGGSYVLYVVIKTVLGRYITYLLLGV